MSDLPLTFDLQPVCPASVLGKTPLASVPPRTAEALQYFSPADLEVKSVEQKVLSPEQTAKAASPTNRSVVVCVSRSGDP